MLHDLQCARQNCHLTHFESMIVTVVPICVDSIMIVSSFYVSTPMSSFVESPTNSDHLSMLEDTLLTHFNEMNITGTTILPDSSLTKSQLFGLSIRKSR